MNEPYLASLPKRHINLRPLIDDKRLLRNPHKGWYLHYVDNGFASPLYRSKIEAGDYLEDFPALNHLYLRVDWSDIEKEEGCFDWSQLDGIFEEWGAHGYRFSFRFCCFETAITYATPKWVKDAGSKGCFIPPEPPKKASADPNKPLQLWEPDYGDPIFLEKLDRFLSACAEKYDGHPLVEFIDVGSYGTWGEGHTYFGSNSGYPAEVIKKHLDIHLKHFRKTPLIMNDDLFSTLARDNDPETAYELAGYAAAKGMGARDDSVCVKCFADAYGLSSLKNPQFFDKFYETAPVDIEMDHLSNINEELIHGGFRTLEALRRSHASYAGFHGDPRLWLKLYPYFTEYCANRLGYWYFPLELELDDCVTGMFTIAKLHIDNQGFARAYNPFTLKVKAVGDKGEYELFSADGLNLNWHEGKHSTELLKLDFNNVEEGSYKLMLGLFEGDRPIELAVKSEYVKNGYVELAEISVYEPKLY